MTYIGKYGCHSQYFKLKECLADKTAQGQSVGLCDTLYDAIGECILTNFHQTEGKGVNIE